MKMDDSLFSLQDQLISRCSRRFCIRESSIDYPRETLSPYLWGLLPDGTYKVRYDAKEKIHSILDKYPGSKLRTRAAEIRIVGSICSNQYVDDTDIDVHLVMSSLCIKFHTEQELLNLQKSVKSWFDTSRDGIGGYIGKHPIEVYIQLNSPQDFLSVGVYDLENAKWKKGPTIVPSDYDPYEDFTELADDVRSSVSGADLTIGELKRDIVDWETMKMALVHMDPQQREMLLRKMQEKLEEVEEDVKELYSDRKDWVTARKASTATLGTMEQALQDVKLVSTWEDANAIFKFINRYKYIKMVGELGKMVEDDKIGPEEIDPIKRIIGEV